MSENKFWLACLFVYAALSGGWMAFTFYFSQTSQDYELITKMSCVSIGSFVISLFYIFVNAESYCSANWRLFAIWACVCLLIFCQVMYGQQELSMETSRNDINWLFISEIIGSALLFCVSFLSRNLNRQNTILV